MLKKYKNELLNIITNNGFQPSGFVVGADSKDLTFKLTYKDTRLIFILYSADKDYHQFRCQYTIFSPNYETVYLPDMNPLRIQPFEYIQQYFTNWLYQVKLYQEELFAPDLWASITDSQSIISGTDKESLEYFTSAEKDTVRLAIRDFMQLIEHKFEMDTEQHSIVSERLDYLAKAVDKSNKFDWKGIALNTIISISITLSLDAEKGRQLFELFKTIFGNLVRLLH